MPELFPRFTQDTRLLRLSTPLGPERLLAESVRGEESLDRPYRLQVSALSLDAAIPLKSLLGQPVLLEVLTAMPGMPRRPFHGHITSAQLIGANGGFARYSLTIEPWFAFLALGRDSRIFQDKTVFEILDAVFQAWPDPGTLVPAWRYDIADRDTYPVRSLTCQYQESNLAFVRRLMHEAGLFYYIEHSAAPDSERLGSHTLVIANHNGSFQANPQAEVRFTQAGAVMREDSVDRWHTLSRPVPATIDIQSWDYRSLGSRRVSAGSGDNTLFPPSTDTPGSYAYPTRAQGQRIADNQLQALQVSREIHSGAGTVRTFMPGTTFTLSGHARLDAAAGQDAARFTLLRVWHLAHNNLAADLRAAVTQALGSSPFSDEEVLATDTAPGERPLYRNRFEAIRSTVPYRSSGIDGHGVRLHPRPTISGQQTAIVVGPPGAVIHTDRDHRIKVQFHWQRNAGDGHLSHSRLDHPAPAGQTGAPADDRAGTWIRIATPLAPIAGANWGAVAVPRVGSEVLVDFIDGDIDRPVVIGSLYNGKGQPDAQHNSVAHGAGNASGNAPAWFPGEHGGHAHAAVLSGIKSQALSSSQDGSGAYQQLVFDDSPGQARVALQSHAGTHQGTAELNLGSLRHQTDNQRLSSTGFGAELKTAHAAALRAGQGLLLSTDGSSGNQLDVRAAVAVIEQSHALQVSMATTARAHKAVLPAEPAPEELPAVSALRHGIEVLESTGERQVTAFSEPQLQLSSSAGIVACTPADAVIAAGHTSSVTAGQDVNFVAQGCSAYAVKDGISLFTYGKASAKDKPNQETGIRLHAASGKVSSQSQSDATRLTADKSVTVASVSESVTVTAKTHVLLTAQGAYLKLEGGDIMLHAPGKLAFKASMKELAGPKDGSVTPPVMPAARDIYNEAFVVLDEDTKQPMAHVRYRLESASGVQVEGITDAQGRTQRIFTSKSEVLTLHLAKDE
ncbi:type VI secretion system Vgr family protein [Massilia phyllosphaerae]|uniref:type VI secretion system Vgr family protein n=1 Tax=Massilia phyllosphaerae TaxID=3106034 RepID=UPI002B1CC7A7|nr:type VI secretion system Vgr family protein [Massilia sp. SGZ-792]